MNVMGGGRVMPILIVLCTLFLLALMATVFAMRRGRHSPSVLRDSMYAAGFALVVVLTILFGAGKGKRDGPIRPADVVAITSTIAILILVVALSDGERWRRRQDSRHPSRGRHRTRRRPR